MDVAAFLAKHPPFDSLAPQHLERIGGGVRIEFFPEGDVIIQSAGQPARFLYVIRRGAAELLEEEHVLDVLGEGEAFGYLSLLSGLSPVSTVRAAEDTICYLIDATVAEEILGTSRGLAFVSSSLRRQLLQVEHTTRGTRADPHLVTAASLVRRRPVTCEPTDTVRAAAETMAEQRVSSLLVRGRDGLGIVTDRDLRTRVLAAGLSSDAPVSAVMTHPALTVDAETTAAEVLSQMLEREFHHFPVVDDGRLVGVITDTDLMRLERYSPFALKSAIRRAESVDEVVAVGRDLPRTVNALVEAHTDPVDVGHVVGVTIDALTTRLIDLSLHEVDVPPVPWAWMALGSAARHEQALSTDQDHALAYEPQDVTVEEADAAFADLARRVTDGLEAVGIPRCNGGAMAETKEFRRPTQDWVESFKRWMSDPGITGSIFTSIVFDYRRVTGSLGIEAVLDDLIRAACGDEVFLRHMARRALDRRPPTGFRGNLVVEGKGEHAGRLDVKHGGITLITNIARVLGIGSGLTERSTVKRLRGAAAAGRIPTELQEGLDEAFGVLWRTRLDHHVRCWQSGRPLDDFVDPATLGPLSRRALKESFAIISQAQDALATEFGVPRR
jgi:CBS domain-containing protein